MVLRVLVRKYTLICLILLLFRPATGNDKILHTRYLINKIHISGNQAFTEKKLKKILEFRERKLFQKKYNFSRNSLEVGRINLQSFYIARGFLRCVVTDSFSVMKEGGIDVFYHIEEGRQYILKAITITGNHNVANEDILEILNIKTGSPYNPIRLRNAIGEIKSVYEDIGRPLTEVTDSLAVNDSLHLFLRISESATFYVNNIHISTVENVKPRCVRREIHFNTGDPYSRKNLTLSKKHIYATGLFSSVNISWANIDTVTKTLDLAVDLRELKKRSLGMDIGFGQNRGVSYGSEPYTAIDLKGEWLNRNLFSRGTRLSSRFRASINTSNILLRPNFETEGLYVEPWLFGFRSSNLFRIFLENQLQDNNELFSYGFETALIIQPDKRFYLRGGLEIKDVRFRYEHLVTQASQYDKEQERALTFILRNDNREPFLFPRGGNVFSIESKLVGTVLGGTQDYFKIESNYSIYRPLYRSVILALRAKAGWMKSLNPDLSTPLYEKFYLGGETSMRAWKDRTFYNIDGTPQGNDVKLLTNAEIRFPIIWLLGGEIFLDGGLLSPDIATVPSLSYRWNYGIGLTIATPLGPVRVDYARIINPTGDFEIRNPWQIQFAIPYAF